MGIIKASDGKLYFTAERVIFKMDADGTNIVELRRVTSSSDVNGFGFTNGVTEAADGKLYGIAHMGGANGKGVVYRLDKDGANYTVLHSFSGLDGTGTQSNAIRAKLIAHSDGNVYGATRNGGASDLGVLFKIASDGTFTKLADFGVSGASGLVEKPGGNLLITLDNADNRGALFEATTEGVLTPLYGFSNTLGSKPVGAPLMASDGHIYGTTANGGSSDSGTLWRRKSTGEFEILASFSLNRECPASGLIEGSDGLLYGSYVGSFSAPTGNVFSATKGGVITRVSNGFNVGVFGGVTEGPDGDLYASSANNALARITKSGTLTTLKTFTGADGGTHVGPPVFGSDGAIYGVTSSGGANGRGTFWKYSGSAFTMLRAFQTQEISGIDTGYVGSPLTVARDGSFHGLLMNGGDTTHYRITTSGVLTVLGRTTGYANSGPSFPVSLVERNLGVFYSPFLSEYTAMGTPRTLVAMTGASFTLAATLDQSPETTTSYTIAKGPLLGGISRGTDRKLYGVLPDGAANSGSLYRLDIPASGDPLPGATTLSATSVQSLSATLNANITLNGTPAVVYFEYGPTAAYGKRTPGVLLEPGADATVAFSAVATGLTRNTPFRFRVVAENDGGTTYGADLGDTTTSNSAPTAAADIVPIRAKEILTISVLANDNDPDGDPFTMDAFTQGANGTVTRNGDNLIYTPGKTFTGTDTFTYTLSDSLGAQSVGTVTIRNPFLALSGSYTPLVGDNDGLLTLKLTTGGALSGKLKLGTKSFSIKGIVALGGTYTQTFKRNGFPDLVITLNFAPAGQLATVSGSVNGAPSEQFPIAPDAKLATVLPIPAVAGKYTLALQHDNATMPAALRANGWAVATLSPKGAFTLTGLTTDGKPLSLAGKMRIDTSVVLFKTAAAPASSFVGKFTFADSVDSDFSGSLRWTRGAVTKGNFLGTIDTPLAIRGCLFVPPAKNIHTLAYTAPLAATGRVLLENGDLATPLSKLFTIDAKDKALIAIGETNTESVKLTINRATGMIEGTFKHLNLPKTPTTKFRGVQLQTAQGGTGPNSGTGFFPAPASVGPFTYTPQ
jgi:uncharacterized repeat protein (TIGR03803 family)